jgi:hypothetical protein
MKHYISLLLLGLACNCAFSQPVVSIQSPKPNEEVCLGSTLPISASFKNRDSVARKLVARFVISNIVTNSVVYDTSFTLPNVPSGVTINKIFPDYVTSIDFPEQLGSFLACAKISALDAQDSTKSDWPFTDSMCTPLFSIRMMKRPLIDHNNDYSITAFGDIPDQTKWVSSGANVIDGQNATWDPPPPLARPYDTIGFGLHGLRAPIVKLDRLDKNGNPYIGARVGDTITSFPINLAAVPTTFGGKKEVILSFDYQRAGKTSYPLLWDKTVLHGPEQMVLNAQANVVSPADSLIIEFKDTTIQTCNPEKWNRIAALPGGRDFEFDNFWVLVPTDTKYYDSTFRFRIILKASDNSVSPASRDDADPWYLDNITVRALTRKTHEMEVMWARVITPHTKLPFTASRALPVRMRLKNLSHGIALSFPAYVAILNDRGDTVYSKIETVSSFQKGDDTTIRFPDWDARSAVGTSSKFFVYGRIRYTSADTYPIDDTTYSTFYLNVEQDASGVQEFALDDAGNDIPDLTGLPNTGIGFAGTSGSYAIKFTLQKPDTLFGGRIYWASANAASDSIRISVLSGNPGCFPSDAATTIATFIDTRRPANAFATHRFPQPIALASGTYWLSVSQLSKNNYMIGGDFSRGGARITVADSMYPRFATIYNSPHGTQTSPTENTGEIGCMYAVEMPAGSGTWGTWMPSVGWWPVHKSSFSQAIKLTPQLTAPFIGAGTYLPMIRPMVGSFRVQQAQTVQMLSPKPNEEVCLGATMPISVRIANNDTAARTIVARFVIRNVVTNVIVYDTSDTLRNVPYGVTIDTTFPDYVTNPNLLTQLGSFLACTKISALNDFGNPITNWRFADSSCVRIFGIRTTTMPFNDAANDYSKTSTGDIPDQRKWISLGATVVEGDNYTWDPPPPQSDVFGHGFGIDSLYSPLIRLDRSDVNGQMYGGTGCGDTLTSFPLNLDGRSDVVMSFDFMRTGRQQYPSLWDANTLIGPEHSIFNVSGQQVRAGDSLIIEFSDPAEPKCNPVKWDRITGLEGGHDFEFQKFWMYIKDSTSATVRITGMQPVIIPMKKYFDSTFRFRLRLKANYNAQISSPTDDNDPWYLDNIWFHRPSHPELEVMWVRVVTPYSKIPHAAASALPVYVKLRNALYNMVYTDTLRVDIRNSNGDTVYYVAKPFTKLTDASDSIIRMPDWDAQSALGLSSKFTVHASITLGYDGYDYDDQTYSTFYLNVEQGDSAIQEFALDNAGITPFPGFGNDIPSFGNGAGSGIGFSNTSGSYAMKFVLSKEDTVLGARLYFGSANSSSDAIGISVLRGDSASCIPLDTLHTFIDTRKAPFDQFTPYYFPQPIILPAGIYWLSASQLTLDNFAMGGTLSRGGGMITLADNINPQISPVYNSPYGTQWSRTDNSGDVSCAFAVETPAGSGQWLPWMPTSGWWPANSADVSHQALLMNPKMSAPFIRAGTYMPMIRPMVGTFTGGQSHVAKKYQHDVTFEQRPNPFDPKTGPTELNFILTESGEVSLTIYDAMGREIRTLIDATLEKGQHTVRWDGKDANGSFVASGVYVCRLSNESHVASIRKVVVR